MPSTSASNRPLAILMAGLAIAVVFIQVRMATTQLVGQGYANFGRAAQRAGDLSSARFFFERSTRWYPHDWKSQYFQAGLLQRLGELDEASAAFEKSLALAPHETLALTNYARLLASRGELVHAAELNDRALHIAPSAWRAHEVAGFMASVQGNHARAAQDFERAINLSLTADPRVMNELANALYHLHDYERALTYAEMAIKKEGLRTNHRLLKGKILLALDRPEEAILPLTQAEQDAMQKPVIEESRRYLASAQIEAGQIDKAALTLDRLVQVVGPEPYAIHLLDEFSTALAKSLHAPDAKTQYHYGRALIGVTRYEEAAQAFARAFPELEGGERLDCGALYAHALKMVGRPDLSLAGLADITAYERRAIKVLLEAFANQ